MPSEFTTRNLQYRTGYAQGLHRAIDGRNRSVWVQGSLYAMEHALHEWMLDSPIRTRSAEKARAMQK